MCVYIYIIWDISHPPPSAWAECSTKLFFKQSFPSFCLVAIPKLKSPICPTIHPCWRENHLIHTFLKGISAMWNEKIFCPGFELILQCPFPTIVTMTYLSIEKCSLYIIQSSSKGLANWHKNWQNFCLLQSRYSNADLNFLYNQPRQKILNYF